MPKLFLATSVLGALCAHTIFHEADKGAPSGGGGATLKDQLASAQSELQTARTDLQTAQAALTSEQTAHNATKGQLSAAQAALTNEQTAHNTTKSQLSTITGERDALQAQDKSAGHKAAEQLAKNGVAPSAKDAPKNLTGDDSDPVATWESYMKANSTEQARMRASLGNKLDAAATAYDRAQAK